MKKFVLILSLAAFACTSAFVPSTYAAGGSKHHAHHHKHKKHHKKHKKHHKHHKKAA